MRCHYSFPTLLLLLAAAARAQEGGHEVAAASFDEAPERALEESEQDSVDAGSNDAGVPLFTYDDVGAYIDGPTEAGGEGDEAVNFPTKVAETPELVRHLRRASAAEGIDEEVPMHEADTLPAPEERDLAKASSVSVVDEEALEELVDAGVEGGHRDLASCGNGNTHFKVQIRTNNAGRQNRWVLKRGNSVVAQGPNGGNKYGNRRTYTATKCLGQGTYKFIMYDAGRDGMGMNGNGLYRVYINGAKKFTSPSNTKLRWGSRTHTFQVRGRNPAPRPNNNNNRPRPNNNNNRPRPRPNNPQPRPQPRPSNRSQAWLNAHNVRRRKYNGGKGYVPLRWSNALANDARRYAQQLANNCNSALKHARGIPHGENLAKNVGSGSWGTQRSPDQILTRWVENERNLSYPANGHMTQVVWRATRYVGCGEAQKNMGGGKMCHVQACRYTKPGNCGIRNKNWQAEAWKSDTQCGPRCPPGGC